VKDEGWVRVDPTGGGLAAAGGERRERGARPDRRVPSMIAADRSASSRACATAGRW
jgi:hypothetical protein